MSSSDWTSPDEGSDGSSEQCMFCGIPGGTGTHALTRGQSSRRIQGLWTKVGLASYVSIFPVMSHTCGVRHHCKKSVLDELAKDAGVRLPHGTHCHHPTVLASYKGQPAHPNCRSRVFKMLQSFQNPDKVAEVLKACLSEVPSSTAARLVAQQKALEEEMATYTPGSGTGRFGSGMGVGGSRSRPVRSTRTLKRRPRYAWSSSDTSSDEDRSEGPSVPSAATTPSPSKRVRVSGPSTTEAPAPAAAVVAPVTPVAPVVCSTNVVPVSSLRPASSPSLAVPSSVMVPPSLGVGGQVLTSRTLPFSTGLLNLDALFAHDTAVATNTVKVQGGTDELGLDFGLFDDLLFDV